ncbi:MAG: HAMP domain-containing sensor histidine kinase, partial [Angelakisella sp.]
RVQIYATDGTLLGDSGITRTLEAGKDVTSALRGSLSHSFERMGEMSYISCSAPLQCGGERVGAIRYLKRQNGNNVVNNMAFQLFLFSAAALFLCYLMSLFIAGRALQPAAILHRWLATIKNDEIHTVPEVYDEEYMELADTLSSLVHSNKRSLTQLKQEKERQNLFFNSATHQLKTPLTSIIGYSEIVKRMSDDPEVQLSADYIEQAGKNLLYTVEDIIDISRYQKTDYEFTPEWFCLRELCLECIDHVQPRLTRSGIRTELLCPPQQVFFDYSRTKESVLNMIDNAILYSGGDCITIQLETFPMRLLISDNGSGIDPVELQKIFEPFYRPAKSATRGSGLGISICKEIMTAQGGDLEITAVPGGGTCAILYFENKEVAETSFQNMRRRI